MRMTAKSQSKNLEDNDEVLPGKKKGKKPNCIVMTGFVNKQKQSKFCDELKSMNMVKKNAACTVPQDGLDQH